MTVTEQILTIAICALGTMATRFLPFIIFSSTRPIPRFVQYLGKALPGAVFGMLVVYCLKNVSLLSYSFGLPELIAIIFVVLLFSMLLTKLVGLVSNIVTEIQFRL